MASWGVAATQPRPRNPTRPARSSRNSPSLCKPATPIKSKSSAPTSRTTEEETIDGDKATVTAKLTNGNGLTDTETFDLNKKGDQWVIDMSDTFDQLGTTGFANGEGPSGEPDASEGPDNSDEAEPAEPAG